MIYIIYQKSLKLSKTILSHRYKFEPSFLCKHFRKHLKNIIQKLNLVNAALQVIWTMKNKHIRWRSSTKNKHISWRSSSSLEISSHLNHEEQTYKLLFFEDQSPMKIKSFEPGGTSTKNKHTFLWTRRASTKYKHIT